MSSITYKFQSFWVLGQCEAWLINRILYNCNQLNSKLELFLLFRWLCQIVVHLENSTGVDF